MGKRFEAHLDKREVVYDNGSDSDDGGASRHGVRALQGNKARNDTCAGKKHNTQKNEINEEIRE